MVQNWSRNTPESWGEANFGVHRVACMPLHAPRSPHRPHGTTKTVQPLSLSLSLSIYLCLSLFIALSLYLSLSLSLSLSLAFFDLNATTSITTYLG